MHVKVNDFNLFQNSIEHVAYKSTENNKMKVDMKGTNEKIMNLPLVVEQWKGA